LKTLKVSTPLEVWYSKNAKDIKNESFESTFQGLFSEINMDSGKLGKDYSERNKKLYYHKFRNYEKY
jgi:hypothetical protein